MWRLSLRDLQWRRRRFTIAVAATALVFAMTLLFAGVNASFHNEIRRIVASFHADQWLVAEGASGPFTTASVIPAGLQAMSEQQVRTDLERPLASSTQTIALLDALLLVVAAGIIGSIIYLSALERVRDFAVLKATGASNRALLAGLALQALLLAAAAAVLATILANLLAPVFPFTIEIPTSAYLRLAGLALVVGLLASLTGLRRAVGVDPALAFGGR
jgi:ABC-type antimicrobial peptide transport system permease subunit